MGIIKQTKNLYQFTRNIKNINSGDALQSEKANRYIQTLLSEQGGLYLKVLQYMGTENQKIAKIAYEDIVGIECLQVKEIVERNFPHFNGEVFQESYAASIGQVNKGRIGKNEIAIKLRYPGIKELLEDQLKLLKLIPSVQNLSPAKKWGFDFTPYQESIKAMLDQECDYTKEALELKKWEGYLSHIEGVRVPRVYSEFVKEDIFIQEFIEGQSVSQIEVTCQPREKRQLAEKLVFSFLLLALKYGKMQGDSNFGNYLFKPITLEVIYLDLGQVLSFSETFRQTILNAIWMRINGEHFDTLSFFQGLGFDVKKLSPIEKKLDLLITVLLEPLLSNRPINLKNWNYKKDIETLLGEEKWWFRSAGGTEFFLFMKGFLGLKNLLNFWNVNLNWHQLLKELVLRENLKPEKITPLKGREEFDQSFHGNNIQVRVLEGEDEKVKMTMPFMTLFNLEDYIDDEVKTLIKAEGYNLDEIVKEALLDGGRPKEIINLKKGHKTYFVAIV